MSAFWACDICGKQTLVNPPTKMEMEEKDIPYEVPKFDDDNPLIATGTETLYTRQSVPKMTVMKRQNPITGEIEDLSIPLMIDLKPRAHIVQLCIGNEAVHRDFCKECLDNEILPALKPLWNKLASIKPRGQEGDSELPSAP